MSLTLTTPAALGRVALKDWLDAPHIELMNAALMRHALTPGGRLIVSIPPRHGKSTLISRMLPAWYLGVMPERRVILASYEADFAASWGRAVRDIIEQVPQLGITVRADSSAANRWDIAGHEGGMVTAGVGGPITGRGANLLLIDDPVKNAEQAQSKVYRDKAWEWWLSTAYTRLEPGGSAIVVMTRWHDDDLAGRLLQEGGWEELRLPALADGEDALGREAGEALWPARYPTEALEEIRRNIGSYWWSAMYQQRPQPATGGMFKREWFRRWRHDGPDGFIIESASGPKRVLWKDAWRFGTMDVAASTKDTADYTVLSCWAVTPERDLVLLDVYRVRMEGPDQPALIARAVSEQALGFVAVEKVAYQLTLLQAARRQGLPVRELKADRDKVSRALAAAARYEAGAIYHPASAPWLAEWEEELLGFPTAAHDDQVDTVAYAAIELARGSFDGIAHADSALVWG